MTLLQLFTATTASLALLGVLRADDAKPLLSAARLHHYVKQFNAADEELYANIPNAGAAAFLEKNIPSFECPDADIERTYYFRWWTFRKHIRHTEDGTVITEFLPNVSWSRKHNTISSPVGQHY